MVEALLRSQEKDSKTLQDRNQVLNHRQEKGKKKKKERNCII